MATVTQWRFRTVLATAEVQGLVLFGVKLERRHAAALVRAITQRLLGTSATSAPEVILTGFYLDGVRRFLRDHRRIHLTNPCPARFG